jgi:parallel beta-helix repeat protein
MGAVRHAAAALLVATALVLLTVDLRAEWRVIGQIGGPISAVAVQGTLAYVAVGHRLHIYDISDPAAPREVGSTEPLGDVVSDLALAGSRAYVTAGKDGLHILDVGDPRSIREIGRWDSPGSAEGIAVEGTIAYLADGPFGLQIVDVSDPRSPRFLSSAFDTFFAFDVLVNGRTVYVAAAGAGVLVVDVSDTTAPRRMLTVDTPGYARGLAMNGTTLYVADQWGGVRLMNIANPAQPRETGAVPVQSWAFAAAVSGSRLYVAAGSAGLQVYDLADPEHPRMISAYDVPWNLSWKIAVADDRAFLGVRTQGVTILDVSAPSSLRRIGAISPLSNALAIAASGTLAFVGTQSQGMRIVDIADPQKPRERGRGMSDLLTWAVVADDRRAYTCEGSVPNHYLRVDTTNPDQPVMMASPRVAQGTCRDLTLRGSSLYMPDEFGLEIWDVSNAASPNLSGKLDFQGGGVDQTAGVEAVDVVASTAFVDRERGVSAVDVSDPRNPRLLGSWSTDRLIFDLCADAESVYAISGIPSPTLYVLDARNRAQLALAGTAPLPGPGTRVITRDEKAYVAVGAAGVAVIDATNPAVPVPIERIPIPGFAKELTFAGDRLLVAAADSGVLVLEENSAPPSSIERQAGAIIGGNSFSMPPLPTTRPDIPQARSIAASTSGGRTIVVASTADSGAGTLRNALATLQSGDTITFDPLVFPPDAPATIRPQSVLPRVQRDGTTIDGSDAGVILDGSALAGRFEAGIEIASRGNAIKGLQIINFPFCGLYIHGQGGNVIGGDRSRGRGPSGEGNVISRNAEAGIGLFRPAGNRVVGNLIGTDVTGRNGLARQRMGIQIFPGKDEVHGPDQIGGSEPWEANVIAGNEGAEIYLHNARGQSVIGNLLGTDPTGSFRVGAGLIAVATSFAAGNVITGNVMTGDQWALNLIDAGSHCNLVAGNWIGITKGGIPLTTSPYNGIVAVFDPFNAIVGNRSFVGISISDSRGNPAETIVIGNTIGGAPLPQNPPGSQAAIQIGSAWRTFIGGATAEERNDISGKTLGIFIQIPGIDRTFILGNAIRDTVTGIDLGSAASSVLQGNVIADNNVGVSLSGPTNQLRRNSIYANRDGAVRIDAAASGIPEPPVIEEVTLTTIRGRACAECIVEIFSDAGSQARSFEGTARADAAGNFSFQPPAILRGPNITATATDRSGSTSGLSAAVAAPPLPPRRRSARR